MIYRLLIKRIFRSPLLLFAWTFSLAIGCMLALEFSELSPSVAGIMRKSLISFWFVVVFPAGAIVDILKGDICRESTSLIPDFRKKNLNFFLIFCPLIGILLFCWPFNPILDPLWITHLQIIIPGLLIMFSILLFIFHIIGRFGMVLAISVFFTSDSSIQIQTMARQYLQNHPFIIFAVSILLICLYRHLMLNIRQDSRFYGPLITTRRGKYSIPSQGIISSKIFEYITKTFSKKGSFSLFLSICLKNNPHILLFLLMYFILSFALTDNLIFFYPFFAIFIASGLAQNRPFLSIDLVKPISRKQFFLLEYMGCYFMLFIMLFLVKIGMVLAKLTPLYAALKGSLGFVPSAEISFIVASVFIIAFSIFFGREKFLQKKFLCILAGLLLLGLWITLWHIGGIIPTIVCFSILTCLFLIISFRLDCRMDII